jgi:hypothetical protein
LHPHLSNHSSAECKSILSFYNRGDHSGLANAILNASSREESEKRKNVKEESGKRKSAMNVSSSEKAKKAKEDDEDGDAQKGNPKSSSSTKIKNQMDEFLQVRRLHLFL